MGLYFRVMMTSVTSEELIVILEEKLEQKLAPFKFLYSSYYTLPFIFQCLSLLLLLFSFLFL